MENKIANKKKTNSNNYMKRQQLRYNNENQIELYSTLRTHSHQHTVAHKLTSHDTKIEMVMLKRNGSNENKTSEQNKYSISASTWFNGDGDEVRSYFSLLVSLKCS